MAGAVLDLDGRVVLATGAANGIGWELCKRLAARGARIAMPDVDEPLLRARSGELGDRPESVPADVADRAAAEAAVAASLALFGRLDVVVANAGVPRPPAPPRHRPRHVRNPHVHQAVRLAEENHPAASAPNQPER